jgi:hypothetical protein
MLHSVLLYPLLSKDLPCVAALLIVILCSAWV